MTPGLRPYIFAPNMPLTSSLSPIETALTMMGMTVTMTMTVLKKIMMTVRMSFTVKNTMAVMITMTNLFKYIIYLYDIFYKYYTKIILKFMHVYND